MTDARPEPDKTEAETTPEVRPEPVWARSAAPDPWGSPGPEPTDEAAVTRAAPVEPPSSVEQPAPVQTPSSAEPTQVEQTQVEQTRHGESSGPEGLAKADLAKPDEKQLDEKRPAEPAQHPAPPSGFAAPSGYAPPAGYASPAGADPQLPAGQYPQYQSAPQHPSAAQYPPAPQYPTDPQFSAGAQAPQGPQYPQYTAPQGFGSPQGPGPAENATQRSGLLGFGAQPTGPLFQPDPNAPAGGSDPANGPNAPWYGDASQPTQQLGTSGWPQQPYQAEAGRKKGRGALVVLLVGVCLLVGALGGVGGAALQDGLTDSAGRNPTISLPDPAPVDANRAAGQVTTVAAAVLPSVVSLNVQAGGEAGTGSGFVIDADNGYILTNNHVVTAGGDGAATAIKVVFQDGTEVDGKVVGLDASYDLAVVKVEAKGLRELELGDSDAVRVGDPVVAIGAPLGLQGTVTTGIVSALNRPVAAGDGNQPAFINAIQTDAAINPGNSGGPLVDATGKVIAVNSAIARSPGSLGASSGNIGLGFAIPSNQARRTAEQLIQTGKASHPIIGVSLDSRYTGRGVKVSEQASPTGVKPVTENGPADQAGIEAGDVILKIDGRPVTEPDELIVAIRAKTPGETITLTVLRGRTESEVKVKLSEATD